MCLAAVGVLFSAAMAASIDCRFFLIGWAAVGVLLPAAMAASIDCRFFLIGWVAVMVP